MMKNKELFIVILSSLLLFGFVFYMINLSYTSDRTELIREDIKNDSIIFKQNKELKENDSIIVITNSNLKQLLKSHENRLRKLEGQKPKVRKDTVWVIK